MAPLIVEYLDLFLTCGRYFVFTLLVMLGEQFPIMAGGS